MFDHWKYFFYLNDLTPNVWGHTFMTSTKSYQFCDPHLPTRKNEQQIHCLETLESANTWQISRPPRTPFHVDIINLWSVL